MDFFERLVMKVTTVFFFQIYRISCLVQLLRIRFHKMLHFLFQCLSYNYPFLFFLPLPVLFTPPCVVYPHIFVYPLPVPLPVYPPLSLSLPRFPPYLHPPPPCQFTTTPTFAPSLYRVIYW